ncbi:Mu-like prophage major head subunit gpT family protein, partial [Roseinatronobacter sp. NSM]|uniref:Mu-like prophage major head subunit gpT family protein n=1 Tax=Roseinatronobacter sp. NSM TaxID=3457785 RepID=UPI004035DD71
GFTITNRKFESTISISRDDISDDRLGVFAPMIQSMGYEAAIHPDHVVFGLLAAGFDTLCYDGQNFFDTEHPVRDEDGPVTIDGGNSNEWKGTAKPLVTPFLSAA